MKTYRFLIAGIFLLVGSIVASTVYYHSDTGLFFEEITYEEAIDLENITKIRFKKNPDEYEFPYEVKIWQKDSFRVYRYQALATNVAYEDQRARTEQVSFFQQQTSGILESIITFGALYVAAIGLTVYQFLSMKKNKNQ
jgi:hypothetical protein